MKLPTDAYLTLAQEGRLTTQVARWAIGLGPEDSTDYPDEYFVELKFEAHSSKMRIAVGREEGYLHLSWHGFIYYLVHLKAAFNSRQSRGKSWDDFIVHAIEFYEDVRRRSQNQLIRLGAEVQIKPTAYNKKKVAEMQAALRKM